MENVELTSVRCRISFCILGDRWSKWSSTLQPEPKHHSPSDKVFRLLNVPHLSASLPTTFIASCQETENVIFAETEHSKHWKNSRRKLTTSLTVRDSDLKLVAFERA
jgi:hypothetical protein